VKRIFIDRVPIDAGCGASGALDFMVIRAMFAIDRCKSRSGKEFGESEAHRK
jgi:hypothetical protein